MQYIWIFDHLCCFRCEPSAARSSSSISNDKREEEGPLKSNRHWMVPSPMAPLKCTNGCHGTIQWRLIGSLIPFVCQKRRSIVLLLRNHRILLGMWLSLCKSEITDSVMSRFLSIGSCNMMPNAVQKLKCSYLPLGTELLRITLYNVSILERICTQLHIL